jgi:hypothetical protein
MENIVQLSYTGDIRFSAGAENPKKVQNIVTHSWDQLNAIYHPLMSELCKKVEDLTYSGNNVTYKLTPPLLTELVKRFPSSLQDHLINNYGGPNLIEKILLAGTSDLR